MFDSPIISSAVVAGIVSLVISGVSGVYSVIRNRRRFEDLRKELLAKAGTENFIQAKMTYLKSYRGFESKLVTINEKNPDNAQEAIQFSIDYFAREAREYYVQNQRFLENKELDSLLEKIEQTVSNGDLNREGNHNQKRDFGYSIINFCSELNKISLTTF